jgi:hypothetical protein
MLKGNEGQGFGIVVFLGFLQNRLQVWTQTTVISFEDEFPGEERNAERLTEDRRDEGKERGDDAGGSYGESRFAHGTLLYEKTTARGNGGAMAAWKNQGEHGVFGENTGTAERPQQNSPIPLDMVEFGQHGVAPLERVVWCHGDCGLQQKSCDAAWQAGSCLASAEGGAANAQAGTRVCSMYPGQLHSIWSEPVHVARRDAVLRGYPLGFEQGKLGEAHQNRV